VELQAVAEGDRRQVARLIERGVERMALQGKRGVAVLALSHV